MGFNYLTIFFTVPVMLISATVHEFSHAYVAHKLGDDTAKSEGRMTLNPLAHIDWLGFLSMIFLRIGWAKPVPVNHYNFENPALGNALVSIAGPTSNLFLTILSAGLMKILFVLPISGFFYQLALTFLTVMIFVNISLMLFNLLPIPPLDGSNIVEMILPKQWRATWSDLSQYAPYLLLLIFLPFSPLFAIFSNVWYNLLSTVVGLVATIFGLPGLTI
ncbi:site-2 protease family protein [bacterium]|nr:site-2 protease family protein [bacterium]